MTTRLTDTGVPETASATAPSRPEGRDGTGRGRPSPAYLIRTIAHREITVQLQRTELWVSLVLMVAVFCASLAVQTLFGDDARAARLGVAGERPALVTALRAQAIEPVRYGSADAALAAVRAGEVDAAVVGGGEIVVLEELPERLAAPLRLAHREAVIAERLQDSGLPAAQVAAAFDVAPPAVRALEPEAGRASQRTMTAAMGVMVLFFLMFMFGQGIAQGVLEEKSNRIVELLLGKVRPAQLLAGKVLGIGTVALAQITLIATSGVAVALLTGLVDVPRDAIGTAALVVAWFVPGYLLFATLWAVAGSLVSRQEDIQHAAGPVSFLQSIALLAALAPFSGANDTLTRVLSLVPGLSSSVMPVRMAAEPVPWWDVALAVALTVAAIAALLRVGARIYSGGLLRHGGIVKVGQALRDSREGGIW
nr:MAG: hypothetical protein DIU60_16460 [Actinomycetota bacterium]